jgi:hypothetical protein
MNMTVKTFFQNSTLKEANTLFIKKEYDEALRIYKYIISKYGELEKALTFNILKCESEITKKNSNIKRNTTGFESLEYQKEYIEEHYLFTSKAITLRELHSLDKYSNSVIKKIQELEKRIDVLSFDVFDTVLLRNDKSEARRFWEISEHFSKRVGLETLSLFLARIEAANIAYSISKKRKNNVEGKYINIAKIVCAIIGKPSMVLDYCENEINYEIDNLELSKTFEKIIDSCWTKKVVFMSDMYFSSRDIKILLLKKIESKLNIELVFSSADGWGSKRGAGSLYKHLSKTIKKEPEKICHLGDNYYSDFVGAIDKGLHAIYLPCTILETNNRKKCYNDLKEELQNKYQKNIKLDSILNFNM